MIVLNYHKVDNEGGTDFYTIDPSVLSRHLREIRAQGLTIVTTDHVLDASVDDGMVMLHFDDGTEDQARHVFPLLEAEGAKGVFFISTAKIGFPGYLTIEQVKALATAGHDIECHGHTHRRMDRITHAQLEHELATSTALIREWTGREPRMLAPPGGYISQQVLEIGRRHGLGTVRTMRWNINRIPLRGQLDCLVVTHKTSDVQIRKWLQGRGILLLRVLYLAKQVLRLVLPFGLYLRIRNRSRAASIRVMSCAVSRNEFLAACLSLMRSREVLFCISRNHSEFWKDGPSDIDMLVLPAQLQYAVHCIEVAAGLSGYRLASRTRFGNHSLVFYAPGASLVRIDVDTDVHWRTRTLLDAEEVLAVCVEHEGLPIPSPEHAAIVLLCKCAWLGYVKPSYKNQLEELAVDGDRAGSVSAFLDERFRIDKTLLSHLLATDDVTDLRKCFMRASNHQRRAHNVFALLDRTIRRIVHPPGIVIHCPGLTDALRTATSERLELLFPTAKASRSTDSVLHLCLSLLRGGVFWDDAGSSSIRAKIARLWVRRQHVFHWGEGHIQHVASGQSAEEACASDFIGSMLSNSHAQTR